MTKRSTKVNVFASKGIFVISHFKIIKAEIFGDESLHICSISSIEVKPTTHVGHISIRVIVDDKNIIFVP